MFTFVVEAQLYFAYTTDANGNITITKYTGYGGLVEIPGMINGLPVTAIGKGAFESCKTLTYVVIPKGVTTIGDAAFRWCNSLANVSIPETVKSIGYDAFFSCDSFTNVQIPNSVTNIGETAFGGCDRLTTITVAPSNSFYSSIDGVLFSKSQSSLLQCSGGRSGTYTVPDGVTIVQSWAFHECSNLTDIVLGSRVESIGAYSFCDCKLLTSITLGTNLTSIGSHAFYRCSGLTKIVVPSSVRTIYSYAFSGCLNLRFMCFEGNLPSLGIGAFNDDYNLTVYYLPGATGWTSAYGERGRLWNPRILTAAASFGVATGQFGFPIVGSEGLVVGIEACTNPADGIWVSAGTETLSGGSAYFADWEWKNHRRRFYRLTWP